MIAPYAAPSRAPSNLALALLCGAQFIVILDAVIVNVALPDMQRALNLDQAGLQWVINAYVLVYGGCLLLGGRAADLLGRRRMYVTGILLFSIASLIGGLAPSGAILIGARAIQGFGGALITPAALSLIAVLFVEGPDRNRAMAAQGGVAASGAAFGVLLGGVLTGLLGWQSVLLVNVPLGIMLAVLGYKYLPQDEAHGQKLNFDIPGAVTITLGLAALIFGVVGAGETPSGLNLQLIALVAAAVLFGSFIAIEHNTKHPLLRFGIFKNRQLRGANLIAILHPTGPLTALFFLSLYMQKTLAFSPLQAGLAFLPFALCAAAGAIGVSQLARSISLRMLMVCGFLSMAVGTLLLARLPEQANYVFDILPGTMLVGLGITTAGVPMFISAVSNVSGDETGLAGALINTFQQIGSALVLAILVTISLKMGAASTELDGWRRAFQVAFGLLIFAAMAAFFLFAPQTNSNSHTTETGT